MSGDGRNDPVQDILSESMTSLGIGSSKCYLDKTTSSSCVSLPSALRPFRSRIPVPSASGAKADAAHSGSFLNLAVFVENWFPQGD